MDKITLEFSLEEIRQLQDVCFSSWYYESPGSEVLLDAYKYYNKFFEIITRNYNIDKITLDFTMEEIEKLYCICFSSMCHEPYGSKPYCDATDFGIYFENLKEI